MTHTGSSSKPCANVPRLPGRVLSERTVRLHPFSVRARHDLLACSRIRRGRAHAAGAHRTFRHVHRGGDVRVVRPRRDQQRAGRKKLYLTANRDIFGSRRRSLLSITASLIASPERMRALQPRARERSRMFDRSHFSDALRSFIRGLGLTA